MLTSAGTMTARPGSMVRSGSVIAPRKPAGGAKWRGLTAAARDGAIEELKRRGRATWGATYYSQLAPPELCALAGRTGAVQYGALIGWLKRLGSAKRSDPASAIELVAHLLGASPDDDELLTTVPPARNRTAPRRGAERDGSADEGFEVNCPSTVHDHRFVVVGELPRANLHPVVLLQPQDGTGLWYPQVGRHNPLRAGRAFSCFVRLGNPGGIWHEKPLPLDAKIRAMALEHEWRADWSGRMSESELGQRLGELGVVAEKESLVSRASLELLEPTLHDHGKFRDDPLVFDEPSAEACVAPVTLRWKGGAAYLEVRDGDGDRLVYGGTTASGATLVVRGGSAPPPGATVAFVLDRPGRYRLRLYPAVWSFVDPAYEWWLDVA